MGITYVKPVFKNLFYFCPEDSRIYRVCDKSVALKPLICLVHGFDIFFHGPFIKRNAEKAHSHPPSCVPTVYKDEARMNLCITCFKLVIATICSL